LRKYDGLQVQLVEPKDELAFDMHDVQTDAELRLNVPNEHCSSFVPLKHMDPAVQFLHCSLPIGKYLGKQDEHDSVFAKLVVSPRH